MKEAVAIKSVSAWPHSRPDVIKMMDWAAAKLKKLGAQIEMAELGTQTLPDGTTIPLPPAILGVLGNVCITDKKMIINNDLLVKLKFITSHPIEILKKTTFENRYSFRFLNNSNFQCSFYCYNNTR